MTEPTGFEKLREKIVPELNACTCTKCRPKLASKITDLLKESFPELAKEMGYVKLAKDQKLHESYAHKLIYLRNSMVSLDNHINTQNFGWKVIEMVKQDMLKAGFVKVVKDG